MNITLDLLRAFGLSGYAETYFQQWFEENNISSLQYETALQLLKENEDAITQALEEADTEETYEFYLNWFTSLPENEAVLMFLNEHEFINEWKLNENTFTTLEAAKEKQEELHKALIENAKQYVSISAINVNDNGTETYRSINLIDNVDPEDADLFEFTLQTDGSRRRTSSATLAAIGLFEWMEQYNAVLKSPPVIEQKIQNGIYTAWTPIQ